jgi:hypothetical protein
MPIRSSPLDTKTFGGGGNMEEFTQSPFMWLSATLVVVIVILTHLLPWFESSPVDVADSTTRRDRPQPHRNGRRAAAAASADSAPKAALRPGVGWIHMSSETLSGKGVAKTEDSAVEKCRRLAAAPIKVKDVDAVHEELFENVELLAQRSPIIVSGDLQQRAATTLRKRLGQCFNIISYDDAAEAPPPAAAAGGDSE